MSERQLIDKQRKEEVKNEVDSYRNEKTICRRLYPMAKRKRRKSCITF